MKDYFVSFPDLPTESIWRCAIQSVGLRKVLPGQPYFPGGPSADLASERACGRLISGYAIVLISEGAGVFESASLPGIQPIEAGSVLLLFPGVWHRYQPARETGWVEHWIECRGPVFDEAFRSGLIQSNRCVLKVGAAAYLLDCFEHCHLLAQRGAFANQDLLSTLSMHMLALVACRPGARDTQRAIDDVVERARSLIALRCQEPIDLTSLAARLGVSPSHLRHSFRARVGVSLKQHYVNTRLEKAEDLLLNSVRSIKEIADILGFDSAFHLSKQFKAHFGLCPKEWRNRMRNGRAQIQARLP